MAKLKKGKSKKVLTDTSVWTNSVDWKVVAGTLKKSAGRPGKVKSLFKYVGEKLPFESLDKVRKAITLQNGRPPRGIYLAHDSMGAARYGGRGDIFQRLKSHIKLHARELVYFSFYVVESKNHERELETVVLRAAGPQLTLNQRKVRASIDRGNVADYEPGTSFFERQSRKGKRKKKNNLVSG